MMVDDIRSILLGMWLGAAVFFSAVVAPAVFSVLHSFGFANANEVAGSIVTRTLAVVNVSGFIIAVPLLVTAIFLKHTGKGWRRIEIILLVMVAFLTAVGEWVIAARMRALRTAMGTIDLVPITDPRRIEFAKLHRYSVLSLGIALIVALATIIVIRLRVARYSRSRVVGESQFEA